MSALRRAISYQLSAISPLLIAICLLFIANLFIFTTPAFAEVKCNKGLTVGGWCPLGTENYDDEVAAQRFGRNILVFGHVMFTGTNPLNGNTYSEKVKTTMVDGKKTLTSVPGIGPGNINDGALAMTTNAIASLYTPPTSSVEYLANLGENIGLAPKPAYAQTPGIGGSGDNVIAPVLKLWQVMRNIAYVAFILVFIAAGIMIMFRQKLNPQTVIGIQQALPGLVIGLILVTFSYFIAALIVDLSFVGTRLVAGIFISSGTTNYFGCTARNPDFTCISPDNNEKGIEATYQKSDAFDMYGRAATRVSNVSDVFGQLWGTLSPNTPSNLPWTLDAILKRVSDTATSGTTIISGVFFGPVGAVVSIFSGLFNYSIGQAAGAGVTAVLASLLVPLILIIALMIQFIKLIIALVMTYLQILIMVIFGPFLIMVSAIPGRGGALSYWLKGLLANALVFPAVFAGFLFAGMLLEWNATSLNESNMPMFGGLHPDILKSILAFGVLLGLPSIPEMIRNAFGVKGPEGFSKAAIGGFMGGVGGAQTGYSQAMQRTGLQGRKEVMEKAQLERAVANRPTGGGGPSGFWEGLLSRLPSGRRS